MPSQLLTMTSAEFWALLMLATAVSFTPGPNTTLSTAIAANRGLRPALRFVVAVPVGWSMLLVLCALGVGALILAVPALRWGVLGLGVAYMLWLAWRLSGSGALASAEGGRLDVGFWQGVLLQFVNIKAWMLALSIVAGWIGGQPDWPHRLALVLPVMLAFALASNFAYALVGSALRHWLAQGRRLLWFNRVMALALVATALWMAWNARQAHPQAARTSFGSATSFAGAGTSPSRAVAGMACSAAMGTGTVAGVEGTA